MRIKESIAAVLLLLGMVAEAQELTVRKFEVDTDDQVAVENILSGLEAQPIAKCNWPDTAPYTPEVIFKLFHNGRDFVVKFYVTEESTRALASEDGGRVWEDSCVECFISPDSDMRYYNIETNCIGVIHMSHRIKGEEQQFADEHTYGLLKRYPSLKTKPFPLKRRKCHWEMTLVIPVEALYADHLASWDGLTCKMNFYKCGDKTKRAHYLSWAPIDMPKPNFHVPQFFDTVIFE